MKVLLIDDNPRLAERITHHMGKEFVIDWVGTAKEGKQAVADGTHSIILLDLNLPDMHGFQLCRQLRKKGVTTPIIVISGIDKTESRILLLENGADDYLVKPFSPRELAARIHAILRRQPHAYNENIITVCDLTIDINRRRVERKGIHIPLRRKEFDILEYLASNKGRPVSRSMILNHVWDNTKDSWHNTVDVHIKYLRDKVDRQFNSRLIKTAYGVGYMVDEPT
jgi:DNA-binding response OmpR family regulator